MFPSNIFDYGSKSEKVHILDIGSLDLKVLELMKRNVPKDNTLAKMGHRLR